MMTLRDARSCVGEQVVYASAAQREGRDSRPPEAGRIVRVGRQFVFVDYGWGTAATDPADLDLINAS